MANDSCLDKEMSTVLTRPFVYLFVCFALGLTAVLLNEFCINPAYVALGICLWSGREDIGAVQRWCLISYADGMMANWGNIGYIILLTLAGWHLQFFFLLLFLMFLVFWSLSLLYVPKDVSDVGPCYVLLNFSSSAASACCLRGI